MTPYEQGAASFHRGEAGPAIPKGDATWSERLFNRGWCDARATLSQTLPAPGEVEDPDHQYAVVSADYRRPFLAGAYATLEAALLAQDGKPDRWHIYHRLTATVAAANDEAFARGVEAAALLALEHAAPEGCERCDYDEACHDIAAAIHLLSQGGGK
jgi:hypothetical protein